MVYRLTASGRCTSGFLHAQSTRFADAGNNKLVVDLEPLPSDYWIEFKIGTEPPHMTKDQLLQAIAMYQAKRIQSDATCVLAQNGAILNYLCKVRTAPLPHPVAKKKQ
jgi:hypothetical protein